MKRVGPTFKDELEQAGLLAKVNAWGEDGSIEFHTSATDGDKIAIQAVLSAHNPNTPKPKSKRDLAKQELLARNPQAIGDSDVKPILKDILEFLQESER